MENLQQKIEANNGKRNANSAAENTTVINAIFKIIMKQVLPQIRDIKGAIAEIKKDQAEISD